MTNTNKGKVATLPNAQMGAEEDYLPTAHRWAQMLEKYPPTEGWGVRIEASPALVPLHYGDGTAAPTMLFEAHLRNAQGVIVATGSTLYVVDSSRDWECGETNARHRLLMALGFNPRRMGEDENVIAQNPKTRRNPTSPTGGTAPGAAVAPSTQVATAAAAPAIASGKGEVVATSDSDPDPLSGLRLVEGGRGTDTTPETQAEAQAPGGGKRRKARTVRVPPADAGGATEIAGVTPVSDDDNPLGPPSADVLAQSSAAVTSASPSSAQPGTEATSARAEPLVEGQAGEVGEPAASISAPVQRLIRTKAEQKQVRIDWATIPDEPAAIAWLQGLR